MVPLSGSNRSTAQFNFHGGSGSPLRPLRHSRFGILALRSSGSGKGTPGSSIISSGGSPFPCQRRRPRVIPNKYISDGGSRSSLSRQRPSTHFNATPSSSFLRSCVMVFTYLTVNVGEISASDGAFSARGSSVNRCERDQRRFCAIVVSPQIEQRVRGSKFF